MRNGYEKLRVTFVIDGDAPKEKLEEIVQQATARSAVYDVITNGIPVSIVTRAAATDPPGPRPCGSPRPPAPGAGRRGSLPKVHP